MSTRRSMRVLPQAPRRPLDAPPAPPTPRRPLDAPPHRLARSLATRTPPRRLPGASRSNRLEAFPLDEGSISRCPPAPGRPACRTHSGPASSPCAPWCRYRSMKPLALDPSSKLGRGALSIAIAVVAGLGIGFLLVPRAADDPDEKPPAVNLLGQPLVLDDGASQRALDAVRSHVAGSFHIELPDGGQRRLELRSPRSRRSTRCGSRSSSGTRATRPRRSVASYRASGDNRPLDLPIPVVVDEARAGEAVLSLKDEFDRAPVDARLDLDKRALVKEVEGRKLDLDATLAGPRVRAIARERRPRGSSSSRRSPDASRRISRTST